MRFKKKFDDSPLARDRHLREDRNMGVAATHHSRASPQYPRRPAQITRDGRKSDKQLS